MERDGAVRECTFFQDDLQYDDVGGDLEFTASSAKSMIKQAVSLRCQSSSPSLKTIGSTGRRRTRSEPKGAFLLC
jgi:hypothetical protein